MAEGVTSQASRTAVLADGRQTSWAEYGSSDGTPLVMVHGTEDVNVPVSIARWVATHVPTARLIEQPGAGHLFALEHLQLVFEWVGRP